MSDWAFPDGTAVGDTTKAPPAPASDQWALPAQNVDTQAEAIAQTSPDPAQFLKDYKDAKVLTLALPVPFKQALSQTQTMAPEQKAQQKDSEQFFFLQRQIDQLRYLQAGGDKTPETADKIDGLKKQQSTIEVPSGAGGTLAGIASGAGEQGAGFLKAAPTWMLGALTWPFRKASELLGADPQKNAENLQKAMSNVGIDMTLDEVKALTSGPASGLLDLAKQSTSGVVGSMYGDLVDQGVNPEMASKAAWTVGGILTATQLIPAGRLIPGATRLGEQAFQAAARSLLVKGTLLNLAKVWGARVGAIGVEQAALGLTNALVQQMGDEAAKYYTDASRVPASEDAAARRSKLGPAAAQGEQVGLPSFLEFAKSVGINAATQAAVGTAIGGVTAGVEVKNVYQIADTLRTRIQTLQQEANARVPKLAAEATAPESAFKPKSFKEEMQAATRVQDTAKVVEEAVQAQTPEAAKPVVEEAIAANATEMAKADVLTPKMVNDAVDLADMQATVDVPPVVKAASDVVAPGNVVSDSTLGKLMDVAKARADELGGVMTLPGIAKDWHAAVNIPYEGAPPMLSFNDANGSTRTVSIEMAPAADVPNTPAEQSVINAAAMEKGRPLSVQERAQTLTETGHWIPDVELGTHSSQPWAKSEISVRQDLRDLSEYLAATNQATAFNSFLSAAKELETVPKSDEYYRQIWDSTPKPEPVVDEGGAVDVISSFEKAIDGAVAAEEKVAKKVPLVDRLAADLSKVPSTLWNPDSEVVGQILAARPETPTTPVAGEDINTSELFNSTLATKQQYVRKLVNDAMLKPSSGLGADAVEKIQELQGPYSLRETKTRESAKKAIRDWQAKHPGQPLIPQAETILNEKSVKDLTVSQLKKLRDTINEIRTKGRAETKAKREAVKARRVQMATDVMATIPGGVTVERMADYGSISTGKAEKALANKNKLSSNMKHPLRLFKDMGKAFERIFWDDRKAWEGTEATLRHNFDNEIKALYGKTDTNPAEMVRKLPGTDYYVDTLMYYYGQFKDPDGRRAVLWGNDENEAKISQAISQLPQKFKDWVDGFQDLSRTHYPEVKRVQIEQNGVAAPMVKDYLPIRREQDFGQAMAQELSTEAGIREGARAASMTKGFTNQRVRFKEGTQQPRIRTDLLNIVAEQVTKESRYVAGEQWARDMAWLLGGKSKEGKQAAKAIKQKWGEPMLTFLRDYVNAVIRPEAFNGQSFSGLTSRIFRNLNDAQLMYKLSTMVIQAEGPFRSLAALDLNQYQYAIAGLWKASTSMNKSAERMYEKSPVMRAMTDQEAIDPALMEGMTLRHASTPLGAIWQQFRRGLRKGGYAGLQAANKWTITSEWTSVYSANLEKTGDEAAAVKAANDAVYLHQPSGNLADAPRMYWRAKKNIFLSWLLRFSRANNQTAQMLFFDLPGNVKNTVRGKPEIGKATGVLLAFAIGAALNGMRQRKRFPQSAEELLQDGINGISDAAGSMTFQLVPALVSGIRGKRATNSMFDPVAAVNQIGLMVKDIENGDFSVSDGWKVLSPLLQAGGMPAPAAENIVRSAYDAENEQFRFDPVELFGRRPKE